MEFLFWLGRILFFPVILPFSLIRAWSKSWDALLAEEKTLDDQFQQLYEALAARIPAEAGSSPAAWRVTLKNPLLRHVASCLADWQLIKMESALPRIERKKFYFQALLDKRRRRLRSAMFSLNLVLEEAGTNDGQE